MRTLTVLIALCFLTASTYAQSITECEAIQSAQSAAQMAQLRNAAQQHAQQFIAAGLTNNATIINIPVQVHIIRRTDGSDGLTEAEWNAALDNVNNYFAGADLFFFNCNPPNFIDSDTYFDFDAASEQTEIRNAYQVADVMNVYVPGGEVISFGGTSICGYAYFPYTFGDLIVTRYSCLINGTTFVHEVGHYFGLYHTHGLSNCGQLTDELVNGNNCSTAGDEVCDTPADPNLRGLDCGDYLVDSSCVYFGEAIDENGQVFEPDPHNIMSYSLRFCRDVLTPGQLARANFYATTARDYLSCGSAQAPVSFDIGTVNCEPIGEQLAVPIIVDQFTEILNFQFSVELEDGSIGRFVDVTYNEELPGGPVSAIIDDSTATLVWDNNVGFTLADDDTLAILTVELLAAAPATSLVRLTDEPTNIYAEIAPGLPIEVNSIPGNISVCEVASISGSIFTEDGVAIPGVQVLLEKDGVLTTSRVTNMSGTYSFGDLDPGFDYTLIPVKDDNYLNGVNAGDLSRIQQQLLAVMPLGSAYRGVAADVSMPGNLNSGDLSRIRQLILGDISAFEDVDSWQFVAADFDFPDPDDPTSQDFPQAISLDDLIGDQADIDFIGMKMGDVNNTVSPESLMDEVTFLLSSAELPETGAAFTVAVRSIDFMNMIAAQYSIGWDSTVLQFESVANFHPSLNMGPNNFSFTRTSSGQLPWVWFDAQPVSIQDSAVLFSMDFTVIATAGDSLNLCFTESPTSYYFENSDQELNGVFGKYATTAVLASGISESRLGDEYQVFPNPAGDHFFISSTAGVAPLSVQLFNVQGKLLRSWGTNEVAASIKTKDLTAGVYLVKINTSHGMVLKRLVIR